MDGVKEVKGLVREHLRAKFAEKFSGEEIKIAVNYERRFDNYIIIIKACTVQLLPDGVSKMRVSKFATEEDFSGKALEIVSWVHETMKSFKKEVKDYDLYVGDVGAPFELLEPEVKTPALKKSEILEKFAVSLSTPITIEKDGWTVSAQNIEQEKIGEVAKVTVTSPIGEVVEVFDEKDSIMVLVSIVKNISETGNYKVA
jgi:hypothetical protein